MSRDRHRLTDCVGVGVAVSESTLSRAWEMRRWWTCMVAVYLFPAFNRRAQYKIRCSRCVEWARRVAVLHSELIGGLDVAQLNEVGWAPAVCRCLMQTQADLRPQSDGGSGQGSSGMPGSSEISEMEILLLRHDSSFSSSTSTCINSQTMIFCCAECSLHPH